MRINNVVDREDSRAKECSGIIAKNRTDNREIEPMGASMSSIDVVVPCFRYGRFLRDSVNSIFVQGQSNIRVLIIDNASNDGSLEVAQELARKDRRIEVIGRKKNLGMVASYNQGIEWATAKYFAVLDADDYLAPGSFNRAIAVLERTPGAAFAHGVEIDESFPAGGIPKAASATGAGQWLVTPGINLIKSVCQTGRNPIGSTTVVRRFSAQKLAGYYVNKLDRAVDLNMWLRLALLGDVAQTTAIQAIRRIHSQQLSQRYREAPVKDFAELLEAIDHFFAHEGSSLTSSRPDRVTAARNITRNAFITGMKKGLKGHVRASSELMQFCLSTWARSVAPPTREE
jgi:glycosyltransferase involved in cell wall biosynthesis